jgi:hypothetical protein
MKIRTGRFKKKEPPPKDRSSVTKSELDAFIAQSRWLIDYHDKRGDSLTTRATALLGFSGVILALLLRGPLPSGVSITTAMQVAGVATVLLLLACALFCLLTILPGPTTAPGVDELRQHWVGWLAKDRRGKVLGDIADSYLMAHDSPDDSFPVGDAYARADRRAGFFNVAASAMLAALTCLAFLLFLIYQQVR